MLTSYDVAREVLLPCAHGKCSVSKSVISCVIHFRCIPLDIDKFKSRKGASVADDFAEVEII